MRGTILHPIPHKFVVFVRPQDDGISIDGLQFESSDQPRYLQNRAKLAFDDRIGILECPNIRKLKHLIPVKLGTTLALHHNQKRANHLVLFFGEAGALEYFAIVE